MANGFTSRTLHESELQTPPGWTDSSWARRCRGLADACKEINPTRADELRQMAAAAELRAEAEKLLSKRFETPTLPLLPQKKQVVRF